MLATIVIYLLVQLGIVYGISRWIKGEADYLAAGRTLGMWPVALSLFATWFGAETIMGSSAAVARNGLSGSRADPFGYTICLVLLALCLAYRLRAKGYLTIADFFKDRFGPIAERFGVLIYIPMSIIWSSAQLLAFALVIKTITDLPLDEALLYTTFFVIFYTSLGGLLGDVVTDVIQGCVLIVGLGAVMWFILDKAGGIGHALSLLTPEQLSFTGKSESFLMRLDAWMIPILGSLISQEALSRTLAARDASTARKGALLGAFIYLTIGSIPIILALVGVHLEPQLVGEENFLLELARMYLSPVLFVVFLGALVSAILSTVDSTLLAVGGLLSHNLVASIFKLTDHQKLNAARLSVVFAGVVAYFFASGGGTIYDLVQTASSFGSAGILVIALFGLWTKFGNQLAAVVTLITGVVVSALCGWVIEVEAPFLLSIAASLIAYIGVSVSSYVVMRRLHSKRYA